MEILYPMFGMIVLTGVIMLASFFQLPTIIKNFGNLQAAKLTDTVTSPITTIICLNKNILCNRHLYLFS